MFLILDEFTSLVKFTCIKYISYMWPTDMGYKGLTSLLDHF